MKFISYISALFCATALALVSCSQDEDMDRENNDAIQSFQLDIKDAGFFNAETRAVDVAYKTTFTDGDAVGVFAIRNGKIVENINNRKFEMIEGTWELDGDVIEYKESDFKKMQFLAYYPYNENTTIDPSATEDPFAKLVKNWKVDADQSGDNYTKYDLMTSVGTTVGQTIQGKMEFTMQHRMGLAIIKMPALTYSFTNTGIEDYELPIAVGSDFKVNGTVGKPHYDAATGTYIVLVKPDTEFTIAGSYTGVKEMEYSAKGTLSGGAAKQYTIKDESKITRTLAVGDYFCADGKLVSKDADVVPDNCIGIIFYLGNPQPSVTPAAASYTETNDALRRDYPNCKHGLVIALNNANVNNVEGIKFADTYTTSYFGAWFLSDDDWKDKFVACDAKAVLPLPGCLGYNNTTLMEKTPNQSICSNALAYTNAYRTAVSVPLSASKWFVPSLYEFDEVAKVASAINSKLNAAAGTELIVGGALKSYYWSSNERTGTPRAVYQHNINVGFNFAASRDVGSHAGYFRLMLAF